MAVPALRDNWPHHDQHMLRTEQGLLYFNSSVNARHPIVELIEQSQRQWEDKLARQSRTLHEAVVEYERRYSERCVQFGWCPSRPAAHAPLTFRAKTTAGF